MTVTDHFVELARAVRANETNRVAELLVGHPELRERLNEPAPGGHFGSKVLLDAVGAKNRTMIELLLQHGADINTRSDWWAGSFGVLDGCPFDLAVFLIQRGAALDVHAAARLGMIERLKDLLARNPSLVHAHGGDGQRPLHFASTEAIADLLLQHGADIDAKDVDHESTAAQWMLGDRIEIARHLVRRGARSDILMAAALGDVELTRHHLEENPASVATRVTSKWFPMTDPRAGGTIYNWTLERNRTAHAIARERGHLEIYRLLLERSPDPLKLAVACEVGEEELIRSLLKDRPDLARQLTEEERASMVYAAWQDDLQAVRRMLSAHWPVEARDEGGATALHAAAFLGNPEMVRELLSAGAPTEVRDAQHHGTPFGWALYGSAHGHRCRTGNFTGVVEALLSAGVKAPPVNEDLVASPAVRALLERRTKMSS
jgi:ankyrin repeat protein